jgi:hypothetical protein
VECTSSEDKPCPVKEPVEYEAEKGGGVKEEDLAPPSFETRVVEKTGGDLPEALKEIFEVRTTPCPIKPVLFFAICGLGWPCSMTLKASFYSKRGEKNEN